MGSLQVTSATAASCVLAASFSGRSVGFPGVHPDLRPGPFQGCLCSPLSLSKGIGQSPWESSRSHSERSTSRRGPSGHRESRTKPLCLSQTDRQTDGPGIGRRRGWRGVGKGSGAAETRAPPVTITLGPSREEVPRLPGLEAKGVLPLPERLDTAPPPDSWTPSPCFLGVSTGSRPGGVADLAQEASFVLHKQVHISLCDCPGAPGSSRVSRSGDTCPECRQSLAPGQMCAGLSTLFW